METLRLGISDTVNELNKLLRITRVCEEETQIRQLRRIYYNLWEEVIEQEINKNTSQYKEALEALAKAQQTIEVAKTDIGKVADAINYAVIAAKAVDKIVNLGFNLLA